MKFFDTFPHTEDDCSGNLSLEESGEWDGTAYYDTWCCTECGTIAYEDYTPDGFSIEDSKLEDN